MSSLSRIRKIIAILLLTWSGHASATTFDEVYLQCTPLLITVETTWAQRLGNWWHSVRADEVTIGVLEVGGDRRIELMTIAGQVYPDRIDFQWLSKDYSIDRVELRLSWVRTIHPKDNGEVPCTLVNKTEFQSLIRQHEHPNGEVKL